MAGGQWAVAGFMHGGQLGIGVIGQSIQCNKIPVPNLTNDSPL